MKITITNLSDNDIIFGLTVEGKGINERTVRLSAGSRHVVDIPDKDGREE